MTKGKKAKKKEKAKRVNNTAHQRALASPETQAMLSSLRENWNSISARQRGKQLSRLINLGCSGRRLSDELSEPASNIYRYIRLITSPIPKDGRVGEMNRTLTKKPLTQEKELPSLDAERAASRISTDKGARTSFTQPSRAKSDSTTKEPRKPLPTPLPHPKGRPLVNQASSEQENCEPEISLVEQYRLIKGRLNPSEMLRLSEISNSINRRPIGGARSMKRQGKPLPQTDPEKPVS